MVAPSLNFYAFFTFFCPKVSTLKKFSDRCVVSKHSDRVTKENITKMLKGPYHSKRLLMSDGVIGFGPIERPTRVSNRAMPAASVTLHDDSTNTKGRGIRIYRKWEFVVRESQDRSIS